MTGAVYKPEHQCPTRTLSDEHNKI